MYQYVGNVITRLKEVYVEVMEMPRFGGRTRVTGDILDRIDFLERYQFSRDDKIPGLILKEVEQSLKDVNKLFQRKAELKR